MESPEMNDTPQELKLAGIEYVGIAGVSKDCQDGVLRYIQFGDHIVKAKILTSSHDHCLLLTLNLGDLVAVKSGFASGYGGEGPNRFSYVLQVLESHEVEIEEVEVTEELLERLDNSALTHDDIKSIYSPDNPQLSRWLQYIRERHFDEAQNGSLWKREFPNVIPYRLVDTRIMDLALSFWKNPDNALLTGYRRLEDTVRERIGSDDYGMKLFSQAFNPKDGSLTWKAADSGERAARMQLFTGTYGTHRNRRAHKELGAHEGEMLSEFLLLNHLYRLEKDAIEVTGDGRTLTQ